MKHRQKKIKFKKGQDASQMMTRKLATNLLQNGYITTTESKAKKIKMYTDKLISVLLKDSTAKLNTAMRELANKDLIVSIINKIKGENYTRVGGHVNSKRLYARMSDGTVMMKLELNQSLQTRKKEVVDTKVSEEKQILK
ncbi:MAG: L17 family ribosomal protein [Candidatus Roizmanbacteria bacterium]